MFKHSFQAGLLAVLHANGSAPLQLWSVEGEKKLRDRERGGGALRGSHGPVHLPLPLPFPAGKDGAATRATDHPTGLACIDITGTSPSSTFIACPPDVRAGELGVRLPHLHLLVKSPGPGPAGAPSSSASSQQPVSVEVTVRDAEGGTRRLRASTAVSTPRVTPALAALPLRLAPAPTSAGWCRVRLDLAALLSRAYPADPPLAEVVRLRLGAGARVRTVYFAEANYVEGDLPAELRLVVPAAKVAAGGLEGGGAEAAPPGTGAGAPPVACV